MLDDLDTIIAQHKRQDLVSRLENKRADQALPAEMELAVLWSLAKIGDLEVEPEWYGTRIPDAYTESLLPGRPCVVEVTAISDGQLAQENDMRRIVAQLVGEANKLRRGSGRHLFFEFQETRHYVRDRFIRKRKLDRAFAIHDCSREAMRDWLLAPTMFPPLQIVQGNTHVVVTWHPVPRHPHRNFHSSMPAEAYSVRDTPLFKALQEKSEQLASETFEGVRCVVIADAGSQMLRDGTRAMRSHGTVGAAEIIDYFLNDLHGTIDVVVTLAPIRTSGAWHRPMGRPQWRQTTHTRRGTDTTNNRFNQVVSYLPAPRFEGYQARSLHQQGALRHDAQPWYEGTTISMESDATSVKISSRLLLDLLVGNITLEEFLSHTSFGRDATNTNIFKCRLDQGDVLSNISFESGGLDRDDDWVVIKFTKDAACAPLRAGAAAPSSGS